MRHVAAPITPEELVELRALHLKLPKLRQMPWHQVEANPVVLGCLRNTLEAQQRARADREHLDPVNFELVP